MSHKQFKRPWGIFLAIALAVPFGSWAGAERGIFGVSFYSMVSTASTLFLNALTLVVVPLVFSSIIAGISRIGNEKQLGRLGLKMFAFYLGTSLLAILIGLFFVNLIQPGSGHIFPAVADAGVEDRLKQHIANQQNATITNVLFAMVPSNILKALGQGEMLGLIFFALLFGYSISKVETQSATLLRGFFQGIFLSMIEFTHLIMKVLPYGVFALVARAFMSTGLHSLAAMAWFALSVLLGLITFMFIALPLLLKWIGRVRPQNHFKAMAPALVTAFSTSSSSATLPITMECVEKRAGVSNRICSLVIPLGTSINMSGSALYECVAAMFLAQVYGIDLSFATQFLIVAMALITSIGVAGVPSASLVAILVILKVVGLPAEGIGFFIAVDRLLDMCRTTVNVFSDSCCAVLVAKSDGEKNILESGMYE